jgi:hypothetical protein
MPKKMGESSFLDSPPESCDYKLISKQFSELIYTELFTVSVLLRVQIFYRYYTDIGN